MNHAGDAFPVGKFVTVSGGTLKLHYHEAGERQDGKPTLLFLHGSGIGASGYSNFRRNYLPMAEAGWHVLALDYLGYGYSDMPADYAYTNENQVKLIDEFLTQLGIDQVIPVGNSLGGFFALEYTLKYPAKVPKVICMAPGGVEDTELWVGTSPGMMAMREAVALGGFNAENFRALLKLIVKDEIHLTDEVIAERLPIAQRQPREVYTTAKWTPIWDSLDQIKVPVLGFWGYHDQFLPVRHALIMQEKIPDCRMILSNRAGHWFMIEEREMFNAACLEFINS